MQSLYSLYPTKCNYQETIQRKRIEEQINIFYFITLSEILCLLLLRNVFKKITFHKFSWWIMWFSRWKSSLPRKLIKQERYFSFFLLKLQLLLFNLHFLHCLFSVLNNVRTFSDVSPSLHIINFHNSTSQMENIEHWEFFQTIHNSVGNACFKKQLYDGKRLFSNYMNESSN